MTSSAIAVVLFVLLFAVGLGITLGGLLVVFRSLRVRPAPRSVASGVPPARAMPAPAPKPAPLAPQPLTPSDTPAADEWNDEVPTAVFRPSDYKDIEALMHDADKYVSKHKGDT